MEIEMDVRISVFRFDAIMAGITAAAAILAAHYSNEMSEAASAGLSVYFTANALRDIALEITSRVETRDSGPEPSRPNVEVSRASPSQTVSP
jgi:hypothetical protein